MGGQNKTYQASKHHAVLKCLKTVFDCSSWCEHILRGPGRGGHWNHQAFEAPSRKLHEKLRVSDQDPCRGGIHHHLLHRHPGEPAAQWRTLQVRFTQQHRRFSGCRTSVVTHFSVLLTATVLLRRAPSQVGTVARPWSCGPPAATCWASAGDEDVQENRINQSATVLQLLF